MSHPKCSLAKGWKRLFVVGPIALVLVSVGCQGMNHTEGDAAGGALGGGIIGAMIGKVAGGNKGALIGAAAGAVTGGVAGGLVGNAQDKKDEQRQQAVVQAQANAVATTMEDVISMTQQHISDDVIIARVRASGVVFRLTGPDITNLKSQGVSDAVVTEMLATVNRVPVRQVYVRDPERPVVIYENPPPPPPAVIIGGGYYRRW